MKSIEEINEVVISCRRCSRLVNWREKVAKEKRKAYADQEYWGKPVPGFGDSRGRVFVIGLAPGAHGSNRTGRQFTGDASGDFLFPALYRAGFSTSPSSVSRSDDLQLVDLYTAPVCRCVPPDNKPSSDEIKRCITYLNNEFEMIRPKIMVTLGKIAFENTLRLKPTLIKHPGFKHNAVYPTINDGFIVCSYHPSRQNTQTRRLTMDMFDEVWKTVRYLLNSL